MVLTLDTSHFQISALKDFAFKNMECMLVTLDTSHLEMSALKDCAFKNIDCMSVTLDTFHLEISASKALMSLNNPVISSTLDTSHSPIGTCRSLPYFLQSNVWAFNFDSHALTAALSSDVDFGSGQSIKANAQKYVFIELTQTM